MCIRDRGESDRRRCCQQVLYHPGQQQKTKTATQKQRQKKLVIPAKGLPWMSKEADHGFVEAKGHAQHTTADARKDGTCAYDGSLEK